MRLTCIDGYEWPGGLLHYAEALETMEDKLDVTTFYRILNVYDKTDFVLVTFLSKEYLNIGKIWLNSLENTGIKQVVVMAADKEAADFLDALNVPNCRMSLTGSDISNSEFKSRTGFSEKGLEITAAKFPVVRLVLEAGFETLLIDIDALLLRPLDKAFFRESDIVFQRVVYFPEAIVKVWGFAACSGFVWFKSNRNTIALVENAIQVQKLTYDDQLALNVALWEADILWENFPENAHHHQVELKIEERKRIFATEADKNIDGAARDTSIRISALSPQLFWRNDCVDLDFSKTILFHPNSLKDEMAKLEVYKKLLDIKYSPTL